MRPVLPWVQTHLLQTVIWVVWAFTVIVVIGSVIVGVTFAVGVRNCQSQLNLALIDRSELAEERNAATTAWLRQVLQPPPEIANRTINDPERRDYNTAASALYAETLRQIDEKRAIRSYPEPTICGR